MKLAKASKADLDMAVELAHALESLAGNWGAHMPEKIARPAGDDEAERFDIDSHDDCRRVLQYLIGLTRSASLFRVVMGMAVLLDPANRCVDPNADTLEHHPDAEAGLAARTARPSAEWDPDIGPVLWWKFPINEPPYCGTPLDTDWPGYYTHWTPLVVPAAESTGAR